MIREERKLFSADSETQKDRYSLVNFYLDGQVTIRGVDLHPDDEINFEVCYIDPAKNYESRCCFIELNSMPDIKRTEYLYCDQCVDNWSGHKTKVRLTYENPIVILDSPQGAIIRAEYSGPGIGSSEVWASLYTDIQHVPAGLRGCPEICCVHDDSSWRETGPRRSDLENDNLEGLMIDNCGNYEWQVLRKLRWVPTGQIHCDDAGENRTREEINDMKDTRWVDDGPQHWVDTGTERCENHIVQRQQVNECHRIRWIDTDETCGYDASLPLPGEGFAYTVGDDRDPEATEEFTDCGTGETFAWIYPTPRPGATVSVRDCEGKVLGYARNQSNTAPVCNDPQCFSCKGDHYGNHRVNSVGASAGESENPVGERSARIFKDAFGERIRVNG